MPRAVQEEEAEGKADGGKGLENPFKVNPYKSKDNVATATTAGTEPVAAAAAAVAEVAAVSALTLLFGIARATHRVLHLLLQGKPKKVHKTSYKRLWNAATGENEKGMTAEKVCRRGLVNLMTRFLAEPPNWGTGGGSRWQSCSCCCHLPLARASAAACSLRLLDRLPPTAKASDVDRVVTMAIRWRQVEEKLGKARTEVARLEAKAARLASRAAAKLSAPASKES